MGDLFHIAHGDQSVQSVLLIHHKQLVDPHVLGEKFVCDGDRIIPELLAGNRVHLSAWSQRLGNLLRGVTRLDHMAGEKPHESSLVIHNRECAEPEVLLFNEV